MKPFPAGLQIVAGNSKATAPQRLTVTWWDCGELDQRPAHGGDRPQCQDGNLSLHVNFPDCWDGKNLAYANQKNTAYSVNAPLPEGLPRPDACALPARQVPADDHDPDVELASGGQYSGHADFINAWDQSGARRHWSTKCLNAYRHCGVGC